MKTRSEKRQAAQSRSLTGNLPVKQYQHSNATTLADNRPEAVAQRKLQEMADNSPRIKPLTTIAQSHTAASQSAPVVQRVVQVGTDIYSLGARDGLGKGSLIGLIKANQGTAKLCYGWRIKLQEFLEEEHVSPRAFTDIHDLITYLTKSDKKTPREKFMEQDQRIQGLNTGYGATELHYGSVLSYESQKAFERLTGQVQEMKAYTDTKMDVESYAPGVRSTTSDFTHTPNPFINLYALQNAGNNLQRLDYMAPHGVEITTHGYESRGDRSVSQSSLGTNFGLGPMKIGPDIGSYKSEMDSTSRPDQYQLPYLNALEMLRFPHLAPQTAMKRELYDQGLFSKDQGMGFNHNHSSVEFVGAVSGSGMTNEQRSHLRRQQTYSNYAILQTAYQICPNAKLGKALGNGIYIPTSADEMNALTHLIQIAAHPQASQEQKDDAKRELRKVLTQVLRAVTQIKDVDSEDEDTYPTSPYDPGSY